MVVVGAAVVVVVGVVGFDGVGASDDGGDDDGDGDGDDCFVDGVSGGVSGGR